MKKGDYAIGKVAIIPVRATHKDQSEIVTQLLFGELITVVDVHQQWIQINIQHDQYKGWVDEKQLLPISEETAEKLNSSSNSYLQTQTKKIETPWGKQTLVQGTPLLSLEKHFTIDAYRFSWEEERVEKQEKDVVKLSKQYLNAPYLWGGRTPFGIDCSGFSQTIFHQLGFSLKRDASQQVLQGDEVVFSNHQTGDLAFFSSQKESDKITHVGIIFPEEKIIHAHGRVRIDKLDNFGILNEEENTRTHFLKHIKRINK